MIWDYKCSAGEIILYNDNSIQPTLPPSLSSVIINLRVFASEKRQHFYYYKEIYLGAA
jgi:hypothetical protein